MRRDPERRDYHDESGRWAGRRATCLALALFWIALAVVVWRSLH